jgi:predicted nucleic acid-binding protein
MSSMPGDSFFLDTNILVYANDGTNATKQTTAIRLIAEGIRNEQAVVSTQVLSEFWVRVTQKIHITLDEEKAEKEIDRFKAMRIVSIEYDTVRAAIHLQKRLQISYWDSLIISAAAIAGCRVVYSEDLNTGQSYNGLSIVNPFTRTA